MLTVLLTSAGVLAVLFGATWLLSLRLGNVSIVDVLWGPSFATVAWAAALVGTGGWRPVAVAVGATLWGLRLGGHLLARQWGAPEDSRYRAARDAHGEGFARRSLVTVFGLQAGLALVISLPLQAVGAWGGPTGVTALDVVAAGLVAVGLAIEATADEQLRRFKARPDSHDRVLDTGLWAWSRHPNYFGDLVVWVGFGLAAVVVGAWWAVVGTVVMGLLLVAGSGKPILERTIADRRPGYRRYVETTSGFVPLPPRRGRSA